MSLLEVSDLCIRYDDATAVDHLTFAIDSGEAVGLVGESGSGKTQTALAILGLLSRTASVSGSIRFDGTDVIAASDEELNRLRAVGISIVFQDPSDALNPYLRVGDQLRRILLAHGLAERDEADARVVEMLAKVGLPDPERQRRAWPHQLSGGMRQRVMLASALIAEPQLLVADEPTTALDVTVQAQILELLETIRKNTALLLITHDLGVVAGHTERMLILERGRLIESGPTAAVFAGPQHAHTQDLLDAAARPAAGHAPGTIEATPLLEVERLAVSYREPGHGRLHAVKNVDLTLKKGETVAIVGESGSGKSSLARAILGLACSDGGAITLAGERLEPELGQRRRGTGRDLQLVFQNPLGSLNPQMRCAAIIEEPLRVHEPRLARRERRARVVEMLDEVGLDSNYLDRYPHELSGGQAQRVAIARALILRPRVLVCDEAVAALDGTVRKQVLTLLANAQQKSGLAILFISHDLGVVSSISHRVLVMYLGRLVEAADTRSLFRTPQHPYTRALIDAVPQPDPAARQRHTALAGEVPSILSPPPGCAFHPRCQYAVARCRSERPELREHGGAAVSCHRAGEIDL